MSGKQPSPAFSPPRSIAIKTHLLSSASLLLLSGLPLSAAESRPNIVYILCDDLGYGDVHCLNPEGKIATPNMDRIASGGMKFTDAHSSSAVCTPTRYSILTGRYNWRSPMKKGVLNGFSPRLIEPGRVTVAAFLKEQGYATGCIGKWHLGMNWAQKDGAAAGATDNPNKIDYSKPITEGPNAVGFDYFHGISASLDMPPYVFIENDRVTEQPTVEKEWIRKGAAAAGFEAIDVLPALTGKAVDYINGRAADAKQGKPFFLYLPLNSPHTPILPTQEWKGKSGLNDYGDFVMQTDATIGAVLDALDKAGLSDNTLVVMTSDNGCSPSADFPALLEKGHNPSAQFRGTKADIFDGGHRIPFLARWPGHVPPGSTSDQTVCLVDLFATCAGILEKKLPDTVAEDSVSLLPILEGKAEQPIHEAVVHHSINGSFAIRQGNWKLELCPGSGGWSDPKPAAPETAKLPPVQLYDLSSDIGETRNVQAEHPEIVEKLTKLLEKYIAEGRSTPGAPQSNNGEIEIRANDKKPKKNAAVQVPVPVTVSVKDGMTRGGKPYFVKGAGGETHLDELAARGANSIRTWTTGGLDVTLEKAAALNLTVSAGIWLESECSWFSYSKPEQCAKQLERVKSEVMRYRNHPALLAWGIGNEAEGDGNNAAYWQQLDRLAVMVKEIDPAHPTFTAVAGLSPPKAKGLIAHTPHLDYIGVNTYGGVTGVRKHLQSVGWTRPWMLTEWGPRGFWECPKTKSGAPLEQTSTDKAAMMGRAYDDVISAGGSCLGSYVFLWGWKFEASATWFGLLTHDGKTVEPADILQEKWSGKRPANRAPSIRPMKGMPAATIAPGTTFSVDSGASDPDGDPLKWDWAVLPETPRSKNGKPPGMPAPIEGIIVSTSTSHAELKAPEKPGSYRLYLWVSDDKNHAATVNAPFEVK